MATRKPLPKSKTRRLTVDSIIEVKHPETGAFVHVKQADGRWDGALGEMVFIWILTDNSTGFETVGVPPIFDIIAA